jgi:sarcosine oxidase subunit gamma
VTAGPPEYALGPQVTVRGTPPAGFPTVPNTTAQLEGRLVLWLGPDEWLVLGGHEADYPAAAAAVDVSANRVGFELVGPAAAAMLAQGCPLDLDPAAFPAGSCAQSLLARTQVILVRQALERWLVLVRPSFAPYLAAWLAEAQAGLTSHRSSR